MSAALTVDGLGLSRAGRRVLDGVSFAVAPGEICALMGTSGAGKSTVLRTIAALEPFDSGRITAGAEVLVPGAVPRQAALAGLRRAVGMVFQGHALFEHLSALENVVLAPVHALGWSRADAVARASALLETLGVLDRAAALPRQLSGGEAQRVAIARALVADPQLLLMDEPTSALDPARRSSLAATLRELARSGRSLLVATHDVEFAAAVAHRVFTLHQGAITAGR